MSLESSLILSPQSTPWALEGLIREESCTAMGDGMEAASVHAHLCLFYCISFQSPPRPPLFLGLIHTECRILVPRPGIEPSLLTLEAWSLNHWTTSQGSPAVLFFNVLKYASFFLSLLFFFFFGVIF